MAITSPVIIMLFYLVTSSVADNSDKPVTDNRDIAKEFDDFKKAMTETHARDIQRLEDIINAQGMQIQKLESENAMKDSAIQDLQGKIEKMTAKENNDFIGTGKSHSDETSTKSQVSQKKRGLSKMVRRGSAESKVAIFASVTPTLEHLGQDQYIIFDHAVTNIGSGYLPHHGTFVAPVSGTYVFFITVEKLDIAHTWGHFVVNGSIVAKLDLNYGQSSQMVIVYLRQGEDVSVQNTETDRTIRGDRYSTFSGFLLYEDFSVNSFVG